MYEPGLGDYVSVTTLILFLQNSGSSDRSLIRDPCFIICLLKTLSQLERLCWFE